MPETVSTLGRSFSDTMSSDRVLRLILGKNELSATISWFILSIEEENEEIR